MEDASFLEVLKRLAERKHKFVLDCPNGLIYPVKAEEKQPLNQP